MLPTLKPSCGLQLIRTLMDEAVQANLTVMRAWAIGVTSPYYIQPSPGVFSEAIFRGLDYALDQARQHNIKVRTFLTYPSIQCWTFQLIFT